MHTYVTSLDSVLPVRLELRDHLEQSDGRRDIEYIQLQHATNDQCTHELS